MRTSIDTDGTQFLALTSVAMSLVIVAADLLGAAMAVPMLIGLHSTHMLGWCVLLAGSMGIAIGALFYRKPDLLTPWALTAPAGEQMLFAFASVLVISSAVGGAIILGRRVVASSQEYDFAVLNSKVRLIDEFAVAGD